MKKNQIFIKCGTEYKEMTKELLEACDLAEEIEKKFETKSSLIDNSEAEVDCFYSSDSVEKQNSEFGLYNMRIGIKPNLVAPMEAYWGGTTHPEVVAGIVEYLQEKGFSNLVIMEGSWVGDKTSESYEVCGFKSLCEKYNVPFLDMQKEKGVPVQCGDMILNICKSVLDLDFLINVPVLKGHCQTKITCALKNMKGLLPNSEKRRFHALGLHDPIAHLGLAIHQDFIVVDNICGDLDFEDGGNPCGNEPCSGSSGSGSYGCLRLRHDVLSARRSPLHHKGCRPWRWLRRHPPGRHPCPRRNPGAPHSQVPESGRACRRCRRSRILQRLLRQPDPRP